MRDKKTQMILTNRHALKADIFELTAVEGSLVTEQKEATMHGRWYFLTMLSDVLGRTIEASDIRVVSIKCDASLIRAKGPTGEVARLEAVDLITSTIEEQDTCVILFRQDTWKIIQVKDWNGGKKQDGLAAGMALLGQPGSGKTLEVLAGTTSARLSGFFGNCLLQKHGDAVRRVRYTVLTAEKQTALAMADCPKLDFGKYGLTPALTKVHDGSVQINGHFFMNWLYGEGWKTRGIKPLPSGTVVKTFRMAVKGLNGKPGFIVKGNGFIRWAMPRNVDIYVHEENIKRDWNPSFDGLVVHGIVTHTTALRTDRQWLTMFQEAGNAVFMDYLNRFFERFESAVREGNASVKAFLGQAIDASEEEFFEQEEYANATAAAKILSTFPIGQFPQLSSQIMNAATGGSRLSTKVALGGVVIPEEFATRVYILPDLSGFGPDGYYYPSRTALQGYEAVCGRRTGEHVVTRSPHSNPWEVRILELVEAKKNRPAVGTVWVSWQCIADVLKTLGGADLDDQVGLNCDKRVIEGVRAALKRPALWYDEALEQQYISSKGTPCSPSWQEVIDHNLSILAKGNMAVVGAWAATVCRYLPVYRWLDSLRLARKGAYNSKDAFCKAIAEIDIPGVFLPKTGDELATATTYSQRFKNLKVRQLFIEDNRGRVTPLMDKLWLLVCFRPVYHVLLQPWFGEEYIDASNGKPSGNHNIVGLFNEVSTRLDRVGVGEVYAFAGSGDKKVPFGLSQLFMGHFTLIAPSPREEDHYILKGVDTYVNGVTSSVFRDVWVGTKCQSTCVHQAAFKRGGGSIDDWEALLPKVFGNGRHAGKAIAYRLWGDQPEDKDKYVSRKNVGLFFKGLWRPGVSSWEAQNTIKQMVAALYFVVQKNYVVKKTSQYYWDTSWDTGLYDFYHSLPEGPERLARLGRSLGAVNVVNIKKAKLTAMLRNMAYSNRLPAVDLPSDVYPTQKHILKAAALVYTYMGCTLADSRWDSRVKGPRMNGAELLIKHRSADIDKVSPVLAKQIDAVGEYAGLDENVIKAAKIAAANHIVNDRLLWEGTVGPRTAFMLNAHGILPEGVAEEQAVDEEEFTQDYEEAYNLATDTAVDDSLWFTDDLPQAEE